MSKKLFFSLLFALLLASCESNAAKEARLNGPGIFEANGMEWTGPYLNFYGSKPAEMEFEAWAEFATRSPACRGASILQSDDTNWFNPGGAAGAKAGVAQKAYYLLPDNEEYAFSIPVGINDNRGCDWHLSELLIYAWHPYTSDDPARQGAKERSRNDLLMLSVPPGDIKRPTLATNYEIMCQRKRYERPNFVMNNLECLYPEQKGQYTSVSRDSLRSDKNIIVNVRVSDEMEIIK